ncbi:MAG: hypothetical protein HXY39_06405 [Chloroflexi bacterium]|nr:hypothetical protein [Chloroflexota bacterium]
MTVQTQEWWERARRARDQLIARFGTHPSVTLIDIGLFNPPRARIAGVRIHVRDNPQELDVPETIDGIPVRVVSGDFQLQ